MTNGQPRNARSSQDRGRTQVVGQISTHGVEARNTEFGTDSNSHPERSDHLVRYAACARPQPSGGVTVAILICTKPSCPATSIAVTTA